MKVGFGFTIPTQDLVPVATPNPFRGFGDFGGTWEDWCDVNYWTPENNTKCKDCNRIDIPILGPKCTWPDPKTVAGRMARQLPMKTDLETLGPPGGQETTPPGSVPSDDSGESWFDKNKLLVIGGGGVAALALIAFAMSKGRGRRMNGFAGFLGFRHPKRRIHRRRR